jgi:hypothetical protein
VARIVALGEYFAGFTRRGRDIPRHSRVPVAEGAEPYRTSQGHLIRLVRDRSLVCGRWVDTEDWETVLVKAIGWKRREDLDEATIGWQRPAGHDEII